MTEPLIFLIPRRAFVKMDCPGHLYERLTHLWTKRLDRWTERYDWVKLDLMDVYEVRVWPLEDRKRTMLACRFIYRLIDSTR